MKNERRTGCDRRVDESGPPHGWRDRCRRTERRIPEISEQEISEADWETYFGAGRSASGTRSAPSEAAAEVFDKIRD